MKHYLLFGSLLIASSSGLVLAVEKASEARLDEVAKKGRMVMPFNLEQTLLAIQ